MSGKPARRAPAKALLTACAAVAASLFGALGCGAVDMEESVSETQEAATTNIATWDQLVAMGTTGNYKLTADINAAGKTWTPKSFSGTLDGGGNRIYDLRINNGSFFSSLTNATIKNLRFTGMRLTGGSTTGIGGLATLANNTTIDSCAVQATINVNATQVGGLVGSMTSGKISRSYAKGSITGSMFLVGGLVGNASKSSSGAPTIVESYAQMTITPDTSGSWPVVAGGILGTGYAPNIYDVYAVGNVTGRGKVGGIAGELTGVPGSSDTFLLYKSIYRGDVVDKDRSSESGGWAGAVGSFCDCTSRFEMNFYDKNLDPSTNKGNHQSIQGYTTTQLRSPDEVTEGIFCVPRPPGDPVGGCQDNAWGQPNGEWNAGTSTQHHVLTYVRDASSQPR